MGQDLIDAAADHYITGEKQANGVTCGSGVDALAHHVLLLPVMSGRPRRCGMYEQIDHTADVGLRLRCATLDALFNEAGFAFVELIVPSVARIECVERRVIELSADRLDTLLCAWLNELLFLFETEQLVLSRFDVTVNEQACALRAAVAGATLDSERDDLGYEIKAVTYHGLRVEPADGGWLAEVILDI
jgi:SHS2 domain-containing protein